MKYPEDELYELIQAVNPDAIINNTTVYAVRKSCRRLPEGSKYKYAIEIESMPGGPYYGPETIVFDKYNMTAYSEKYPLRIPVDKYMKTWDIIPLIYAYYGFMVRTEDIILDSVNTERGIRFTNQCILYEGAIRIIFDGDIDLDDVIVNTELDGFKQEVLDE